MTAISPILRSALFASLMIPLLPSPATATDAVTADQSSAITTQSGTGLPGLPGLWEIMDDDDLIPPPHMIIDGDRTGQAAPMTDNNAQEP